MSFSALGLSFSFSLSLFAREDHGETTSRIFPSNVSDVERGLGGEFTLAMDLPPPPRGWLQDDADVACR